MKYSMFSILIVVLLFYTNSAQAQFSKTIDEMETQYKECKRTKPDSTVCSRVFLTQMDSMTTVIFENIKSQIPANQKSSFIQEQLSWNEKRAKYFKKEDENFVYNLKEGNWTKDMIRFTYQDKAAFVLKQIKTLLKVVKE